MVNTVPRFIATPKSWLAQISAANTAADGTGTLATVVTGGDNGSRVDMLIVKSPTAVRAGAVRFYLATSAPTIRLIDEIAVSAASGPKAGAESFREELVPTQPIQIPANWTLRVSTHTSDTFNVFAIGGDY